MVDFPPEKAPKRGLNIYGCAAVNPYKLTIAAEEIGYDFCPLLKGHQTLTSGLNLANGAPSIPYNYVDVDMFKAENKSEWFTSINPNGRMPAIVHVKEDGTSVSVFESGACLLYIASRFDKENKVSYPVGTPEYWSQLSWVSNYIVLNLRYSLAAVATYLTPLALLSLAAFLADLRLRPYAGPGSPFQSV